MPAEKADSIGDDNINATDLWITGEYLNIKYQFYHSNNEDKKHMLNLVINEASTGENDKPDYVNLEFRHNAYNDSQLTLGTGLASFKLDNIAEQLKEKKGLNIRVKSLYDGERFMTIDIKKETTKSPRKHIFQHLNEKRSNISICCSALFFHNLSEFIVQASQPQRSVERFGRQSRPDLYLHAALRLDIKIIVAIYTFIVSNGQAYGTGKLVC